MGDSSISGQTVVLVAEWRTSQVWKCICLAVIKKITPDSPPQKLIWYFLNASVSLRFMTMLPFVVTGLLITLSLQNTTELWYIEKIGRYRNDLCVFEIRHPPGPRLVVLSVQWFARLVKVKNHQSWSSLISAYIIYLPYHTSNVYYYKILVVLQHRCFWHRDTTNRGCRVIDIESSVQHITSNREESSPWWKANSSAPVRVAPYNTTTGGRFARPPNLDSFTPEHREAGNYENDHSLRIHLNIYRVCVMCKLCI